MPNLARNCSFRCDLTIDGISDYRDGYTRDAFAAAFLKRGIERNLTCVKAPWVGAR